MVYQSPAQTYFDQKDIIGHYQQWDNKVTRNKVWLFYAENIDITCHVFLCYPITKLLLPIPFCIYHLDLDIYSKK